VVRKGRAIAMIDHTGFVLTEDFAGRWQFLFNSADNSARHAHESSLVFACPTSLDRYYILNLRSGDDPTGVTGRLAQLDFTRTNGLVDPPALSFLSPLAAALPTLANFFPEQVVYRQHLPGPFAARFSRSAGERLLLFGSGSAAAGFTIQSLRLPTNGTTVTQAAQEGAHPTEPFLAMTFVPNDPDRAFAISAGGELFERDFSVAGAFSAVNQWILQAGDLFVSRLLPVTRPSLQIYALSQSAIGRFDDDTRTWSTVHVWPDPEETLMSLAAHPTREGTLFLGTSRSVYLSETGGDAWIPYASGLPNVPVTELTFDQGWLYAATYGRGLWRCSPCTG
jgi:hypothetical protein